MLYVAASVDGFIAREDGTIDWLPSGGDDGEGGDYGYGELMARTDVLLMGRATYELAKSFPEWPYPGRRCVVFSSRPIDDPRVEAAADAAATTRRLLSEPGKDLWLVGGGRIVAALLEARLLHEIILTTVPVVLGRGIPLFPQLKGDVRLTLRSARAYPTGLVQTRYDAG